MTESMSGTPREAVPDLETGEMPVDLPGTGCKRQCPGANHT